MSKADELLEKAWATLVAVQIEKFEYIPIIKEIRTYLDSEPAASKPMTEQEIKAEAQSEKFNRCDAIVFAVGVRFAEKHHGIGGGDE